MILKYRDIQDNWIWIDEIRQFTKSSSPNGYEYNVVGEGSDPIYINLIFKNGDVIAYEMYVKEAYICNDVNGSTIDVLKGINSPTQQGNR